jgi:transmembrane sensor
MSRETFHNLLKRYLEGSCTIEERRIVEQWYDILDDDDLREIQGAELSAIDEKLWNSITEKTGGFSGKKAHEKTSVRPLWIKLAVAASCIGVLMSAAYYGMIHQTNMPSFLSDENDREVRINDSEIPLMVNLEDGSSVVLQPHSQLILPKRFSPEKREVYIDGNAFFDVSKNSARPFFVYSTDLITEVVGTSFTVKTRNNMQKSEVAVMTGKVRVSKNQSEEMFYTRLLSGSKKVSLVPNQRLVYNTDNEDLIVTLVEHPVPLITDNATAKNEEFAFNETSLVEVLEKLERVYGIEIHNKDENINSCTFTGDITEEGLYQKLDIICQAIGATYTINGIKILILGGHCN